MSKLKLISYNVGSNSHLAGLQQLVNMYKPDIVFVKEICLNSEQFLIQLGSEYKGVSNVDEADSRRPGTAIGYKDNLECKVTNIKTCRLQCLDISGIKFVNIYAPSGTQGQRGRRDLFGVDLLQIVAGSTIKPILEGDWNSVARPQDVEEDDADDNAPVARGRS